MKFVNVVVLAVGNRMGQLKEVRYSAPSTVASRWFEKPVATQWESSKMERNQSIILYRLESNTVNVSYSMRMNWTRFSQFLIISGRDVVIYDYLNEPTNGIHRAGAIAVGSLAGYIIGIRRGFIRRLLYTSLGGLGVASVCYPKEASEYSQRAIAEAKTYATIVYNFAYGGMCIV